METVFVYNSSVDHVKQNKVLSLAVSKNCGWLMTWKVWVNLGEKVKQTSSGNKQLYCIGIGKNMKAS